MVSTNRVVILIDMDCFYCQVEENLNPELKGKPIAVVQYNAWRGGGIIAVNYPARDEGVTRHMRGNEAKKKCPSINLVQVPEVRGKADLSKYREAGKRVAAVLATFTPLFERASVDEAYLDVTDAARERMQNNPKDICAENLQQSFVVGCNTKDFIETAHENTHFHENNLLLLAGGVIAEEIRRKVLLETGYKCSAGIAHNKILAKLVCALHKPNKQTILPQEAVSKFFETTKITKIKSLGGKFGEKLTTDFNITYMHELAAISEKSLAQKYDEKTAAFLHKIARGIDLEPVTTKLISKSIACCKNFQGKAALTTADNIQHWLGELAAEICERLQLDIQENNREAKQIIVSFAQDINEKETNKTRTILLPAYDAQKISKSAFDVVQKHCMKADGSYHVKFLGLNACNFEDIKNVRKITAFFNQATNQKINPQEAVELKNLSTSEAADDIYFQLTQEVEENVENLIFYNKSEINEEVNRLESNTEELELEDEIIESTNAVVNNESGGIDKKSSTSFFAKYFTNSTNKKLSVSPELDFPGSEDRQDLVAKSDEIPTEICMECKETIAKVDFQSHQDYHFAVKLSQNQRASQSKNGTPSSASSVNKPTPISRKRKNNSNNTQNLKTFFAVQNEPTGPTEICAECSRIIKLDDVESHKDYHAAKKLHREINSSSCNKLPARSQTSKKLGKKKQISTTNQSKSMNSFFKSV